MSKLETPLTRGYWETLGEGTLYEELHIVTQAPGIAKRAVDGVVVLGRARRLVPGGKEHRAEREALSLNGADVIVIQSKATRLNPALFGQALISMDLIRRRWRPQSLRSVMICVDDDPELRPIAEHSGIEVRVDLSQRPKSYTVTRLPDGTEIAARHLGMPVVQDARLARHLRIDGVAIVGIKSDDGRSGFSPHLVAGRQVISVHSYCRSRDGTAGLGMDGCGEVIMAQALLHQMGAARVESAVVAHRRDHVIEQALSKHATFRIIQA